MGASREGMSIWEDIRNKKWRNLRWKLRLLFSIPWYRNDNWSRQMIIKDSFITPFNKSIGCRLFGHNWSNAEDKIKYEFGDNKYCWRCGKWETETIVDIRNKKISDILD